MNNKNIYYRSNDNLSSPNFIGLDPKEVLAEAKNKNLLFNPENQEGVVFHLLGALKPYGKTGYTSIAHSLERAQEISDQVEELFKKMGKSKQRLAS